MWFTSLDLEQGVGYMTIDGNTFYRGAGFAIQTQRGNENDHLCHNTVTNNVIDATNAVLNTGITHDASGYIGVFGQYNTVTGNTVTTLEQSSGIHIKCSDNSITNNTVTIASNGWFTIDITAVANNNVVTGNSVNKPIRNSGTGNTL